MRAQFQPLISRYAAEYGVPEQLIAQMIQRESNWDPRAVSPAGAQGLMQLMPGTARMMGVADPFDPEQSIRGGVGYYAQMRDRFGPVNALGAYHSGPGNVDNLGPRGRAYQVALAPYASDAPHESMIDDNRSAAVQMQPQIPEIPEQQPGLFAQLAAHPLFNMGMGILGANQGNYGQAGPAIGRGAMLGMESLRRSQELAAQQQQMQAARQLARYRLQNDAQSAQRVEEWIASLPPPMQAMARVAPEKVADAMLRPTEEKLTDDMREYALDLKQGSKRSFFDYQTAIRQAGAHNVNIMPGEKAEEVELAKLGVEQYKEAQQVNTAAAQKMGALTVMGQLLDQINTGKLMPAATDIKAWADALHLTVPGLETLAPAQAFAALSNKMTLEARSTASGAGMPGAMSDADREFLRQIVPGLEKSKGANRLLLSISMALAQREQQIANIRMNYFNLYRTMRPTTDPETGEKVSVAEAVRLFSEKNRLFPDDFARSVLGGP